MTNGILIIAPLADIYSGVGNFGAPPLGPWRLAHYLKSRGQRADVWDSNVSASLKLPAPDDHKGRDRAEALAEAFVTAIEADHDLNSYAMIGFSILNDTLPMTLGVIQIVRNKYPSKTLIGGNHEATVNLQDCIGKSALDAVILADAEEPVLALLRGESPHKIPGVLWRNYNPKPSRENFERWNSAIQWGEIPYQEYWKKTAALYDFSTMTEEESLHKRYEIQTVRIHSLVACELACTFSVTGDTFVFTDEGPVEIARLVTGPGTPSKCVHGTPIVEYDINRRIMAFKNNRQPPTAIATILLSVNALATKVIDEGVKPVVRIYVEADFSIKATKEHRFLVDENGEFVWREVGLLKIGDSMVMPNILSGRSKIKLIESATPERVYDITVPGYENFIANGFVAHNCSVKTTRRWASGSNKPSIINLSPSALENNLLAIKKNVPGVMTIYDSSDEAWLGKGRGEEYCEVLERVRPVMDAGLPLGMRYLIQCRTNDLTESLVDRASKTGVRHLTIGVESPVEQVRRDMRKPQREDHVRNAIEWGVSRNIDMYLLFIMFYPTITLEQLYQAVENWRAYISLGATVSVEPFCMSYLGTDLHDDPNFLTEYAGYDIPFTGTPAKKLKWATLIWPADPRVCAILQWFRDHVDARIEAARVASGHRHTFKGFTGKVTVDTLDEALQAWDRGEIPPWVPGRAGARSMVYQDYGDQMSGSELAAITMDRRNSTASRFNSTHALLDKFIKDPAFPKESL